MADISKSYAGVLDRLGQVNLTALRFGALYLCILLYAAFGSPTPDDPGAFEGLIAMLLALAIGIGGVRTALWFKADASGYQMPARIFLLFGLSFPLAAGIFAGNAPVLIARDVVPFLFMFLPLFLGPLFANKPENFVKLLAVIVALGALFALRVIIDVPFLGQSEELFYLANMPSVLFAVMFCAGLAAQKFIESFSIEAMIKSLALLALSALCLVPIIETQQRASLGVFALSMAGLLLFYLWRSPRRTLILAGVVFCAFLPFVAEFQTVLETLSRKTQLVGINMRAAEWQAVWQAVSSNPFSLLVGQGWGATFSSPAVADIEVNFTHGLLSSLLLKTGVIGLGLGLLYLGALMRVAIRCFHVHPVVVLALAGPVLIDVLLYASFKSLDFGLVLALFIALRYEHTSIKT